MESSTAAAADHGIKKRTGRACLPCSAMKAKCIALPGRDECERCHLQNRKCTPRVSGPRKKRIAVVTTKRVAQLEQKLDDLATLLASARKTPSSNDEQSPNPGSRSRSPVPQISQDIDSPVSLQQGFQFHEIELREGLSSTLVSIDPPRFQKTPATTNSQPSTTWAALSHSPQALALDPDNSEAENLLDTFRTECVLYSPLIYIPPNKTARQVQQDTPFLWKVIVAITSSGTPARQSALCTKIMEEICTRLLLKSEKTLELLQGILLFTAWNHHLFTTNPQMNNLSFLLRALVINLGLDHAPNAIDRKKMFIEGNIGPRPPDPTTYPSRTLEERRTFLGCLYLVSLKGVLGCSKIDALPSMTTPYVSECLSVLAGSPECKEDTLLVWLMRLQRIVDGIITTFPKDDPFAYGGPRAPVAMAVKALQGELEGFRRDLPGELVGNALLEMNYHAASIYLYEIALYEPPSPSANHFPSDVPHSMSTGIEKLQIISLLSQCLTAVKSYLSIYHSLPPSHYALYPFALYGESGMVLTTAIKLALFDFPGWDLLSVRSTLDLLSVLDLEIARMESVASERQGRGMEGDKDILRGFARRTGTMRATYAGRVKAEDGVLVEENFQMPTPMAVDGLWGDAMSYFPEADDEFWWGLGGPELGITG